MAQKTIWITELKKKENPLKIDFFFLKKKQSTLFQLNIDYCKDTIWFLSPKSKRIQAQKAQYNEFVESGSENQALMSWVTIIMDPDHNKVKINQFYLKKVVISTIRGDQFLYIFL